MPAFLLGVLLIRIVVVDWGMGTLSGDGSFGRLALPGPRRRARRLGAAAGAWCATPVAHVTRQPYFFFARMRGVPSGRLFLRHGLRNASLPVLAYMSTLYVFLLYDLVVVEVVFNYPGIGYALHDAIKARDLPVIQGCDPDPGAGLPAADRRHRPGLAAARSPDRAERPAMNGLAVGAGMLVALVLVLAVAPAVIDADPNAQSLRAALAAPGPDHWLGTDQYGRSILARLIEGGRHSLASSRPASSGSAWRPGMISRRHRGDPRRHLGHLPDRLGRRHLRRPRPACWSWSSPACSAAASRCWSPPCGGRAGREYYRVSRGVLRQVAASDHVLASRLAGAPMPAVLWYQMLPEAVPYVAGIGSLALGRVILAIASLGFLGIGIAPPQAEWGAMVSELLPHFERGDGPDPRDRRPRWPGRSPRRFWSARA